MITPFKHKSCSPETTLNNVSGILDAARIDVQIDSYIAEGADTWTTVVKLMEKGINPELNITAGKGLTKDYSLASGICEFMERIQTDMLVEMPYRPTLRIDSLRHSKELSFFFDPNEVLVPVDDLIGSKKVILEELFNTKDVDLLSLLVDSYIGPSTALIPFLELRKGKEVMLPVECVQLVCSANGCAAGNDPYEAVGQAFCEIAERWAVKEIFSGNNAIRTIPLDSFKHAPVFEHLKNIQELDNNLVFQVRDCSFLTGIPIIGLLVTDVESGKVKFHLGCAPTPEEALERCLTEMLQGQKKIISLKSQGHSKLSRRLTRRERQEQLLLNAIKNRPTDWPESIHRTNESSNLDGFLPFSSNKAFTKKILESPLFRESDIYVKDCSFLGFPTFMVYVPHISRINDYFLRSNVRMKRKWLNEWQRHMQMHTAVNSSLFDSHGHLIREWNYLPGQSDTVNNFFIPGLNSISKENPIAQFEQALTYFQKISELKQKGMPYTSFSI